MSRAQQYKANKSESGMVSFLITIIMLAVITLIVIGFTQVANRNRRQALDRQLSTQAFYAAESGINQAVTYIKAQPSGTVIPSKTDCTSNAYGYAANTYKLNTDGSVQTSCLLIDSHPVSLHGSANVQQPIVLPINPVDTNGASTPARSFTFAWTSQISPALIAGCNQALGTFADAYANCTYGLLRVDIVQYPNASMTGAQTLTDNTTTLYLQPLFSGGGTAVNLGDFSGSAKSYVVGGACTVTNCQATVNLHATSDGKYFYARITALYNSAPDVMISGVARSGSALYFSGQYVIDATGRAQDVLRRVAVRYNPLTGSSTVEPLAAIQTSGDVCKRLTVISNSNVSNDNVCVSP